MAVLPTRTQDLIDFLDTHATVWTDAAASIGLTPAQATAFADAVVAAQGAYTAKLNADNASKAAALTFHTALRGARLSAADMIRLIKAYAESTAKPDVVYTLAKIPAPADRKPVPAPGQPENLRAVLDPTTGAIQLRWKSKNPRGGAGTSYLVHRRAHGQSEFVFAGSTGAKRFVDSGFVSGPDSVEYTVQAQRSGRIGPVSAILTIHFGRTGPVSNERLAIRGTTTSENKSNPARLAA